MKLKRALKIMEIYDRIEDEDPDISTERLLAMTSQEAGCDDSDVCEAMLVSNRAKEGAQ